jgi:hypothetical protein
MGDSVNHAVTTGGAAATSAQVATAQQQYWPGLAGIYKNDHDIKEHVK